MARRKRLTKNQKAYLDQVNRINESISSLANQGYIVQYDIPEPPRRITKDFLNELYKMNRANLKDLPSTIRIDTETGEVLGNKPTTPNISKTPLPYNEFNINIIDRFKYDILGYPKPIAEKVINFINKLIFEQGDEAVAIMLMNASSRLGDYLNTMKYDSTGAIEEFCADLLNYLPDASDQYKADVMEDIFYESWGDLQ